MNNIQLLIGLDTLWDIVIFCKDSEVLQQSRNFLVDLHVRAKIQDQKRPLLIKYFLEKLGQINEIINA